MLSRAILLQCLEPVPRRRAQILQALGAVEHDELDPRPSADNGRDALQWNIDENRRRPPIGESLDHDVT